MPAGIVAFMRERLHWDVLFVMEHDDLRRAADLHHFRLARQLHRTLVTLDRDYLDDRRFPPDESAGVLVVWAPNEHLLARTLRGRRRAVQADGRRAGRRDAAGGRKLVADPAMDRVISRPTRSRTAAVTSVRHTASDPPRRRRERLLPFAALAAGAAVGAPRRVHARQRQLERHAECRAERDDVFLVHRFERPRDRRAGDRARARGPRPSAAKNAGRASGNGLPASGPSAMRPMPCSRAQDGRLGEQQQVAADEVHVFVRRVVGRAARREWPNALDG